MRYIVQLYTTWQKDAAGNTLDGFDLLRAGDSLMDISHQSAKGIRDGNRVKVEMWCGDEALKDVQTDSRFEVVSVVEVPEQTTVEG